jgi:hypothetical protein
LPLHEPLEKPELLFGKNSKGKPKRESIKRQQLLLELYRCKEPISAYGLAKKLADNRFAYPKHDKDANDIKTYVGGMLKDFRERGLIENAGQRRTRNKRLENLHSLSNGGRIVVSLLLLDPSKDGEVVLGHQIHDVKSFIGYPTIGALDKENYIRIKLMIDMMNEERFEPVKEYFVWVATGICDNLLEPEYSEYLWHKWVNGLSEDDEEILEWSEGVSRGMVEQRAYEMNHTPDIFQYLGLRKPESLSPEGKADP